MKGHLLNNGSFSVGSFDWDANLLSTGTPHEFLDTQTGKTVSFTGWEIDKDPGIMSSGRYTFPNDDIWETFKHATDVCAFEGHRSFKGFIDDTLYAIDNDSFSPSFPVWKNEFLIKARVFNILTARGNAPDNLEKGVRLLSEELLNKEEKELQEYNIAHNYNLFGKTREQLLNYYFKEICDYYPCNNSHFWKGISMGDALPEDRKVRVMKERVIPRTRWLVEDICSNFQMPVSPIALGFSDDSVRNIVAMAEFFQKDSQAKDFLSCNKARLFFTGSGERDDEIIDALDFDIGHRRTQKSHVDMLELCI